MSFLPIPKPSIDDPRSEPFRQWLLNNVGERMRSAGWAASEVHARMEEAGLFTDLDDDDEGECAQVDYWWEE